ncbi:MAG: hypothetical protein V3S68_08700 [Dehalococcoidia bacterium]
MSNWGSSRAIFWGIVVLELATVLAACGGGDDPAAPTETSTPPIEVSLFEELLGAIPDTPNTRKSVMINDYAAVRELLGIPPTGQDAELPALLEFYLENLGPDYPGIRTYLALGPFISGMGERWWENSKREYLAFDGRNVDQTVESGMIPAILEVAWGRFDPAATEQALASCAECPPPELERYNDVPFYSWGPDLAGNIRARNTPPAFDHLGRGGRIAVSSEYVYRTLETPGMMGLIDSRNGDGRTLADVAEFRLLVQAMSAMGVYTAWFGNQTYRISETPDDTDVFAYLAKIEESQVEVFEKLKEELGKSTLLLPYLAFSTGAGIDDAGPYMALALVHSDAESAEENERRLRDRISESSRYPELATWNDTLEATTFRVEGRVLSAKMRGEGPASRWRSLAFVPSLPPPPLIPHE